MPNYNSSSVTAIKPNVKRKFILHSTKTVL